MGHSTLASSFLLVARSVFVYARACVVLEKTQHPPSIPANAIPATFALCFVTVISVHFWLPSPPDGRTCSGNITATTPIFEFFSQSGISGISQRYPSMSL